MTDYTAQSTCRCHVRKRKLHLSEMGRVSLDGDALDSLWKRAGSSATGRSLESGHSFSGSVAITQAEIRQDMGIRKPFRLKGKPSWYVDINRKRRSLHTSDYREAMSIYRDLVRKEDLTGSQEKSESVEGFVSDYLDWANGLHAYNTLKCAREAMAKLQRHIGVLSLREVDQKAIDRLVSGLIGEGLAKSSVNAYLRKIKAALKKAV